MDLTTNDLEQRPAQTEFVALAVSLMLVLAWSASGLDLDVARRFGSAAGFGWRDAWLTRRLIHDGSTLVACAALAMLVVSLARAPAFMGAMPRSIRVRWIATTLASLLVVVALRQQSGVSCPWSLKEFGGVASAWTAWSWLGGNDGGPGQCFPSAHAAIGFAFLCGWHALRPYAPRAANAWLIASLAFGLALSATQVVRGAHFVSHCLWSAWLCWATAAVAFRVMPGREA